MQPWLIWIDDKPENISEFVSSTQSHGITIFQFFLTTSTKAWINANKGWMQCALFSLFISSKLPADELCQNDDCHQLRFIMDNAQWEHQTVDGAPVDSFLNPSAGEHILQFLRGRQHKALVLVFCGSSISFMSYVLSYRQSGSTTLNNVCLSYISAFTEGEVDDREWELFDVT